MKKIRRTQSKKRDQKINSHSLHLTPLLMEVLILNPIRDAGQKAPLPLPRNLLFPRNGSRSSDLAFCTRV